MADFIFSTSDVDTKVAVPCSISGNIPNWIKGSLYRIGSGKFKHGDIRFPHLFDGEAMLHKYIIRDGSVFYQARLLESDTRRKNEAAKRLVVGGFGHVAYPDPCKTLFDRYFSYFFKDEAPTDNDNVNFVLTGDQLYCLTESDGMSFIDKETLEKKGRFLDTALVSVSRHTAHPHYGKDGTIFNLGTAYSGQCMHCIIKIPPKPMGDNKILENAEVFASIPSRWPRNPSYFHSFGMSENHFIILEQTLASNILGLATMKYNQRSFKDFLNFYPNEKTLITLVDRRTKKVVPAYFYAPALFTFHHINAYEDNGVLTIDICAYKDSKILDELALDNLTSPSFESVSKSEVWRFQLPLNIPEGAKDGEDLLKHSTGGAKAILNVDKKQNKTVFCEPRKYAAFMELPRINYAYNERKYRYCYGCSVMYNEKTLLKKVDMETGETWTWGDDNYITGGEPVFIAAPDARDEDEGVILAPIVAHRPGQGSMLVVLDAKTFTEIARATSPNDVKVPLTFHGEFDAGSKL